MSESWTFEAVVLPYGERPEPWCVVDGVLRRGRAPAARHDDRLPGRFVIAGLIDAHTHLSLEFADGAAVPVDSVPAAAARQLEAGVLAVRDVGVVPGMTVPRGRGRSDILDVLGGSRYIAPPGGYFPVLSAGVEPDMAAEVAAAEVATGATWVKVVADSPLTDAGFFDPPPTVDRATLGAIVDAVHTAGGRVAAHVTGRFVDATVDAGVDSVEHGSLVDPALLERMAATGTAWTPTAGTVLQAVGILEAVGHDVLLALARPHVDHCGNRSLLPSAWV